MRNALRLGPGSALPTLQVMLLSHHKGPSLLVRFDCFSLVHEHEDNQVG
jgi:hypothetical protein